MRTTEPTIITQGETIEWQRSFCDYPSDLWTLQYRFRGPGTGFNEDGVAQTGGAFLTSVSTTNSATAAVGQYQWQAWVTEIADTSNKQMVDEGVTDIRRGFTEDAVGTVDLRSTAKQILDSIDAAILAFSTSDVIEYEISTPAGTRRVKRSDKTMLASERRYWAGIVTNEIARENSRNGKPLMQSIKMVVKET